MATTTVSDYVIWAKHIHGDPELVARIHALWAGQTIELEVDGLRGTWRKMDDGADGRQPEEHDTGKAPQQAVGSFPGERSAAGRDTLLRA